MKNAMKQRLFGLAFAALAIVTFFHITPLDAAQTPNFGIELISHHHPHCHCVHSQPSYRSYHNVATIHYGRSTFYHYPNGQLIAHHYNHQTIKDLVALTSALGYRQISLIPEGQYGAIPHHLKDYAYHEFSRAGIYVANYRPHHRPRWTNEGSALVFYFKS